MAVCPRCGGRGYIRGKKARTEDLVGDVLNTSILGLFTGEDRITCSTCDGTGYVSERYHVYVHRSRD